MKLDTAVQAILSKVVDSGAEGDLIIDQGQSLSLKAQDGSLEEHKVTSNRILGLRVIRDAKVGTAYSEAIDEDAIHTMVDQALLNASYAGEEPAERLIASEHHLQTDDTLLCPPDTSSVEEKIDFALSLESSLATKSKVQSVPYNGVQTGFGQRQIFQHKGFQPAHATPP